MNIQTLLRELVEQNGSDLYITTDSPPLIRCEGVTRPLGDECLAAVQSEALALALMSESDHAKFRKANELNLGVEIEAVGRFRVNVHRQRNCVGMVIRHVKRSIPTLDDLKLPAVLREIVMQKRGLVLVTGATGSGKSSTLAAMLDHRNEHSDGHIVTVEDPIEYMHPNKGCIFTQREIGIDTHSFGDALKNALRQAPDVIMIGEIRDRESMEAAITFADTGHLCLGTLHSNNANQTLHRVMNFFPGERHQEFYLQLSLCLRAIISQRLIPGIDGKRIPACEIMRDTPWIRELVRKGEVDKVRDGIQKGSGGCQTFDQHLLHLWVEDSINSEVALANADYPNDLRLSMQQVDLPEEPASSEETNDPPAAINPSNAGSAQNSTPSRHWAQNPAQPIATSSISNFRSLPARG